MCCNTRTTCLRKQSYVRQQPGKTDGQFSPTYWNLEAAVKCAFKTIKCWYCYHSQEHIGFLDANLTTATNTKGQQLWFVTRMDLLLIRGKNHSNASNDLRMYLTINHYIESISNVYTCIDCMTHQPALKIYMKKALKSFLSSGNYVCKQLTCFHKNPTVLLFE